jgi:hypothetical protein
MLNGKFLMSTKWPLVAKTHGKTQRHHLQGSLIAISSPTTNDKRRWY